MKKRYVLFFFLILTVCSIVFVHAQSPYDDEVCLDKTVKQLRKEEQKQKLAAGMNKTLIYASYLNYSDRTVDRIITGKDEFEPHRGKYIRNIEVKIIAPYGVTIEKPEADRFSKFQKFANGIQIKTKDWVVRNDLLFKSGDAVDPILFADTEKNLWERQTFKDVKLFIIPVEGTDNLVDVVIVVQDKWSWSLNFSVQFNKVTGGITFQNFMGLPQSIAIGASLNYRKDNFYNVYGVYKYDNIRRSHIDIKIAGDYSPLDKGGRLSITRDFFSANSKWAGHIKTSLYREAASVPNQLASSIPTNTFYNMQDVWLATSIKMPGLKKTRYDLVRLILSARMKRMDYISRPYLRSADGAQTFIDHTYFLGSIGFANWDYYIDHSVYYLGQAEYFNKGLNGALILGFDYDEELNKRFYSGIQLDYGKFIPKFGYLNSRVTYGGFTKKDSYQQLLFKVSEKFYSAPIKLGNKFMMRQIISANINLGFNRPIGRELVVNNNSGLRGVFVNYIRGARSYVFGFETVVYPTFKILGFSSCAFMFADLAIVQGSSTGHSFSQGYGAGVRLRNLKLGIGYFELAFAYYPGLNIPGLKPYSILSDYKNHRSIEQDNLFEPAILSPE